MEHIINLHIEKLPENVYVATSADVQGRVVQGRTIEETIEYAHDVARKILEVQAQRNQPITLAEATYPMEHNLVVAV